LLSLLLREPLFSFQVLLFIATCSGFRDWGSQKVPFCAFFVVITVTVGFLVKKSSFDLAALD
jgi:hypothetical protein